MKTIVPIRISKIDHDGRHLFISVKLNGKSARLVLDTGASRSVFDLNRIEKFMDKTLVNTSDRLSTGVGTSTMESHCAVFSSIKIGKMTINDYPCVLLDLSHVNNSYEKIGMKPIDGILGSDILVEYKSVIDLAKKKVTLNSLKPVKRRRNS